MSPTCPKCGKAMHRGPKAASGKLRWRCVGPRPERKLCYSTTDPTKPVRSQSGATKKPQKAVLFRRTVGGKTTVLVTAAQNATPAHEGFLKTLETHANAVSAADILVIPYRYKNPTSAFNKPAQAEIEDDEWWDSSLKKYLCNQRKRLNANLILMADIKVQATTGKPLAMMDALSHAESGIFGHPKLQLRTVPTPAHAMPKILTTTGTATKVNYSDTRLGKIAEFHHTIGATVVELHGKTFHLRQINASKATGEYDDLDRHYSASDVTVANRAKALVLGDWHKDYALPSVGQATFGPGGMVSVLKPEVIAWHDLNDSYATNPHHKGNWVIANAKAASGRFDARAELERACSYVAQHTPADTLSVIVPSNHNDFLSRWMMTTDPRDLTGANFDLWIETAAAMKASAKSTLKGTEYIDAFVYWARKFFEGHSNVRVLERGESFAVADVELGLHFDKGPNGARGSLQNLRRIGTKIMGGHGHGPGIDEGGTQVGTATGQLEYAIGGPSGWLNTHGVIYSTGKRSLLNIIGNQWRLT
jgi:hypothetical protein